MKINKLLSISFLVFGLLFLSKSALAQNCATNGQSPDSAIAETSDCLTQPDSQFVTFYKIALCTSQPTAPSLTTPINTSMCSTIFQNTSGSMVNIQKNVTAALAGNFPKPPAGTYSYLYFEIDPTMKVQKTAYFVGSRNGGAGGSGTKCWSLAVNTYAYDGGGAQVGVTCGSNSATTTGLGVTTIINNTLDGASGYVTSRTFSAMSPAPSSLVTYLIDASGKTPPNPGINNLGAISKVAGYTQLSSPMALSTQQAQLISGINIGYENLYGTDVSMGGGTVGVFSGGPLSAYIISYKLQ